MSGGYGAGLITLAQWRVNFRHSFATDRQGNTGLNQEEAHLLLPADSAWLALERPDNPMTITVMMRVEGLTADRLLAFLGDYWLSWDRFRYYPVRKPTGWWWEADPAFSLRHHLQVVPGRLSEAELEAWISARLNEPLPEYRPRWKFWLAPDAQGGAVLVLRVHHCYADGLSLMEIFRRLCPPSPQQAPVLYGARENADFSRWSRAAGAWLRAFVEQGLDAPELMRGPEPGSLSGERLRKLAEQAAGRGYRSINEIGQFLAEPEDTCTGLNRPLLGRRRCYWSRPVSEEHLRRTARAAGVKVNDLLLQVVTSALRARLEGEGADLNDTIVHAAVPVDIRRRLPDGIRPSAEALGNYFGTVFVPLPVDGESRLEQLYRVKHETRKLKGSWQPGISWGLASSAALIPEVWRQPLADLFCRKASVVVSNVPGATEQRYLAGCRITDQMFWAPQAGDIGLGVSAVSYAGRLTLGVVADEATIADPRAFLDDCLAGLSGE